MITEQEVRQALHVANGNISNAARSLNVSRQTVHTLINRYHIELTRTVVVGTAESAATARSFMRAQAAAQRAVAAAVKRGALVPQPCEACGVPIAVAHHHLGYAEEHRLDVQWLCHSHHRKAHVAEGVRHS